MIKKKKYVRRIGAYSFCFSMEKKVKALKKIIGALISRQTGCNLRGKKASARVFNYYKGNHRILVEGTVGCYEEQTKIRSRTTLICQGSSSQMLGDDLCDFF